MTDIKKDETVSIAKKSRKSRATGAMGTSTIQPTSYTEVSRIHRSALASLKGSMVITAATAGEGTTLLSHLMAQRSAEAGRKTLLIDLNMRNTSLSNNLSPDRTAWNLGGRNFAEGFGDLIYPIKGDDKLFFMPAPLDSSSVQFLKDIQHAGNFFDALEKQFDHIVVDTTPVGSLNRYNVDTITLASAARRCVVVMMANRTPKDKIHKSVKQLRESGANVEGIVVNDHENPSLRSQLNALADFFKPISLGFAQWMRGKIAKADNID